MWNTHLKKKASPKKKEHQQQEKPGAAKNNAANGDSDPASSSSASSSTTSNEPEDMIDISEALLEALKDKEAFPEAAPMSMSSCSSSSSLTTTYASGGVEELLELPEIDMDENIWSIIDDDDFAADRPQGDATVPCAAIAAGQGEEEGKEWWLEDLEKELGLWGPTEELQAFVGPMTEGDPVCSYFQSRPTTPASNSA